MEKYLIFLDIDGTLIDSNYQANDDSLPVLIEKIEATGNVVFALNSNRSLEDILPIANQFGINGAIVCENGLFVYFPDNKQFLHLADDQHLYNLSNIREKTFQWSKESSDLFNAKVKWVTEDFDSEELANENGIILIKPVTSRKYTVSLHLKKYENGELVAFRDGAFLLAEKLKENIGAIGLSEEVVIRVSDSHPSILIYSRKYTKHDGAVHLRNEVYPSSKVIAIGNDPDDFEMVKDTGEFWAVKNGKPAALALAKKVSHSEYTKGVVELLQSHFLNAKR